MIKRIIAVLLAALMAFLTVGISSVSASPPMVEAVEVATGRTFMMVPPTNCYPDYGRTIICLFANANDPNTAVWRLDSDDAFSGSTPICVPVGRDQFGQSMNNRTSYIIAKSPSNTNWGWDVWDYTTCGKYQSDITSYVYPNSSGEMWGWWNDIIGSVKINTWRH